MLIITANLWYIRQIVPEKVAREHIMRTEQATPQADKITLSHIFFTINTKALKGMRKFQFFKTVYIYMAGKRA